jgi:hypothetical protein
VAIPAFNTCDPDDYVCCTDLFDAAQHVHDVAYAALMGCLPEGCKDIDGYVMTGPPSDPTGDYLAIWVTSISPATNVNQRLIDQSTPLPLARASFALQLMESGWPLVQPDGMPSPDHLAFASRHSYGHGEVVRRSLYGVMKTKTMPGGSCTFQQMGAMIPMRGGGLVGWRIDFTIGIEFE